MKTSVLLAMVVLSGCGVSQTEAVDGDVLGEDGAELSTVLRTYVTFTRDFRKCASPMCGGWFVTDVNRVSPTPRYVNAIDFSAAGLDEATVAKALDGAETILRGKLGPAEPLRNTRPFLVTDAWRGMLV